MAKTANQKRATKARGAAPRRRSRLSLSLRFSLLMLLAALLPLAAVVGVNDYFTRQTLIQQSVNVLPSDASVTASRIDDYFRERLLDGVALSSLDTAPKFLACVVDAGAGAGANRPGQLQRPAYARLRRQRAELRPIRGARPGGGRQARPELHPLEHVHHQWLQRHGIALIRHGLVQIWPENAGPQAGNRAGYSEPAEHFARLLRPKRRLRLRPPLHPNLPDVPALRPGAWLPPGDAQARRGLGIRGPGRAIGWFEQRRVHHG